MRIIIRNSSVQADIFFYIVAQDLCLQMVAGATLEILLVSLNISMYYNFKNRLLVQENGG